ncbi:uncharacterized protein KGF55_002823 [Candida pseudojiufengensis]|uniref:uncharacterized protein n=1 Tax=Candida pseudojiufengensis TaxID=497109 RepID=UPI0022242840|nr:uncharacterized protein KGF55_002823 [Candida pseudojiufengensis]KAI5963031.1 hypothetical protein KGF55_002823 [Candida pseudojiufengensis]
MSSTTTTTTKSLKSKTSKSTPISLTTTQPLNNSINSSASTNNILEPSNDILLSKCQYIDDHQINKSYSEILLDKQQNYKNSNNFILYKLNQLYYTYIYSTPLAYSSIGESIFFNLIVIGLIILLSYYIGWILPKIIIHSIEKFYYYLTGYSFTFANFFNSSSGSSSSSSSILGWINDLLFLNLKNNSSSSLFLNNGLNNNELHL